ncbi:RraA family protein [Diplocloster modestus]|uniref:RraA family protein n=1 Tax=Diplocloster modestus TaxID=2850322 RepID=A0ABS6K655_9FIRM|nr:RraA family protein [Diplocloster modestus]MBU9726009.1 RraA family protein [Diplocloster modestus]
MEFNCKKDIIQITPLWEGERMQDGRPRVSDEILEKIRHYSLEEVWEIGWQLGYDNQFQTGFRSSNPQMNTPTVGRAVTSTFVPIRLDLEIAMKRQAKVQGMQGNTNLYNIFVVDSLVEDDVWIIDLFDKVKYGTIIGGNLGTVLQERTKRGGAVVWGSIRDLEQMKTLTDINVYYRGVDPTPLRDHVLTGFNTPCRIGGAVCLPGDVVYACDAGVLFIPPHLAEEVVNHAEKTKVRDLFGFQRIKEGVYNGADIDTFPWSEEMMDDLVKWIAVEEAGAPYRHLDWSIEYEDARTGKTRYNRHWSNSQMRRLDEV